MQGSISEFHLLIKIWNQIINIEPEFRDTDDVFDQYVRFRFHRMIKKRNRNLQSDVNS